eukprot:2282328-Pleurochrysis_carterae.AAC.1
MLPLDRVLGGDVSQVPPELLSASECLEFVQKITLEKSPSSINSAYHSARNAEALRLKYGCNFSGDGGNGVGVGDCGGSGCHNGSGGDNGSGDGNSGSNDGVGGADDGGRPGL